jgi:hypothetical protein
MAGEMMVDKPINRYRTDENLRSGCPVWAPTDLPRATRTSTPPSGVAHKVLRINAGRLKMMRKQSRRIELRALTPEERWQAAHQLRCYRA